MRPFKLSESLYYVGVNDRQKELFERMIPLPNGVSYNAYVIVDEKVALLDTVEAPFSEELLRNIKIVLGDRAIDYLIINHMEPDHSSGIESILRVYPNAQIVGNKKTKEMLLGFYGVADNFLEVTEQTELSLGKQTLKFFFAPMVHWPEVMMTYEVTQRVIFTADGFGCFGTLDGAVLDTALNYPKYFDEMYRYYVNVIGKYGSPVQNILKKLATVPIDMICSLHGPIWTKHKDAVISIYDRLSRYEGEAGVVIAYGSMYGHTEQMAEAVARGAAEITPNVILHDTSKSDITQILSDAFRYKGLIIGSATYCNELYPNIVNLLAKIETRGLKNREFGIFGSYSWAGAAVKGLKAFAEKMQWTEPMSIEIKHAMNEEEYQQLIELGRSIALKSI